LAKLPCAKQKAHKGVCTRTLTSNGSLSASFKGNVRQTQVCQCHDCGQANKSSPQQLFGIPGLTACNNKNINGGK
jgi:hypothetical protein